VVNKSYPIQSIPAQVGSVTNPKNLGGSPTPPRTANTFYERNVLLWLFILQKP
jgi:hypothetical protein